jgi:ATP-dependent DNA helicase 2 subunit 2
MCTIISGTSHANAQQVATGRKTAMMSVIGCRTKDTDLADVMESSEGYENIQVFSEIKQ